MPWCPSTRRCGWAPRSSSPGWLVLVPPGVDELPIETRSDHTRMLVLGGEPFPEPVQMWWNFVGRSRQELETAWRDWRDRTDRFGPVGSDLDRIEAPRPPWLAGRE